MLKPIYFTSCLLLLAGSIQIAAADVSRGQALYENACVQCHDTQIHLKQNRKVTSIKELEAEVQQKANDFSHVNWNEDDIFDVVNYLNKRFYKFPE